jgi:hypothetical protein
MNQKATVPVIIGAVLLVGVLIAVLAKTFMAPPPHNPNPPKYPDFIDPATGKPKQGQAQRGSGQGSTGSSTGDMMRQQGGGGMGGQNPYGSGR